MTLLCYRVKDQVIDQCRTLTALFESPATGYDRRVEREGPGNHNNNDDDDVIFSGSDP